MTLLQHYQLSLYLTTAVTLLLGSFLYLRHHRNKMARIFGFYSLLVALWSYCQAKAGSSADPDASLLWTRVLFLAVATFPMLLMCLYGALLELDLGVLYRAGWCLTLAFLLLIFTHWFLVRGGPLAFLSSFPRAGPLFLPYNLFWLGWVVYDIWILARGVWSAPTPLAKHQRKLLLLAFIFGYALACTNYLYFYGFVLHPIQPIATYGVPIAFLVIAYAIFAYGLFDIQVVIRRGLLYALVVTLLVGAYFGLVYAAQQLFSLTLLQHHILALGLTALTTFGLGLLVFLADRRRRLNQVLGLYSLAISSWAFMEAFLVGANTQTAANFLSYLEWPAVIFIGPTFVHTVLLATGEKRTQRKALLVPVYLLSFLLLALHLSTDLVSQPAQQVGYTRFYNKLTPVGTLVPLLFFTLVNLGLWKLWRAYRRAEGRQRTQLKYLFWASGIGYLGGSPDWFLVFGFCVPPLNPFGIYGVPMYSVATAYAVLQHRLFDVNIVVRKSLVYSILVTLLTVGYFGLVYGVERLGQVAFGYQSWWLSLAAFTVMTLLFQPLKIGIQRFVDWLIFHAPHQELVRRMEKLEQETRQVEKLKAVATLAAGLCHEIRNPLQTIQTHVEFLPERYDDMEFRDRCTQVLRTEIGRVNDLLKQLMEFAKPKRPAFQPLEPHKLLDSTLDLLSNEFVQRRIHLEKDYGDNGARIQADPDQLRQVVINLITNALEAVREKGRVSVRTTRENGWFLLQVADTGPGIDPKILPRIFEPFTTAKPGGNGLGLSITHAIVKEHGGTVSVVNQPDMGATFIVRLPLA